MKPLDHFVGIYGVCIDTGLTAHRRGFIRGGLILTQYVCISNRTVNHRFVKVILTAIKYKGINIHLLYRLSG